MRGTGCGLCTNAVSVCVPCASLAQARLDFFWSIGEARCTSAFQGIRSSSYCRLDRYKDVSELEAQTRGPPVSQPKNQNAVVFTTIYSAVTVVCQHTPENEGMHHPTHRASMSSVRPIPQHLHCILHRHDSAVILPPMNEVSEPLSWLFLLGHR